MRDNRYEAIDIELSKRSTVAIEKEEEEKEMEGATKNEEPVRVIFLNQFRTNFIVLSTHYTVVKESRQTTIARYAFE